uniref:Uncharacterized protein n=1 Tax=Arundo donax TaxID=35708 RepID=A0A0A9G489_ARUDO
MASASLDLSSPTLSPCSWCTPIFQRISFKRETSQYC